MEVNFTARKVGVMRSFYNVLCLVSGTAGCLLLSVANHTLLPFCLWLFLVLISEGIFCLFAGQRLYEKKAFRLAFNFCVFVAGALQVYCLSHFQSLQMCPDAVRLSEVVSKASDMTIVAVIRKWQNGCIPTTAWGAVAIVVKNAGGTVGPWIGVIINSFVVGLSAFLAIALGRNIWGEDSFRLRILTYVFVFAGLNARFGSVLTMDAFSLLSYTLLIYAIVNLLGNRSFGSLSLWLSVAILDMASAWYINLEMFFIELAMLLMGIVFFVLQKPTRRKIWTVFAITCCLLICSSTILFGKVMTLIEIMNNFSHRILLSENNPALGGSMAKLFSAPIYIRAVVGVAALLASPLLVVSMFQHSHDPYHIFYAWHGISAFFIFPAFLVGAFMCIRDVVSRNQKSLVLLFLIASSVVHLELIAVTSIEVRHLGAFLPAVFVIALVPDWRDIKWQIKYRNVFFAVAVVELMAFFVWFGLVL